MDWKTRPHLSRHHHSIYWHLTGLTILAVIMAFALVLFGIRWYWSETSKSDMRWNRHAKRYLYLVADSMDHLDQQKAVAYAHELGVDFLRRDIESGTWEGSLEPPDEKALERAMVRAKIRRFGFKIGHLDSSRSFLLYDTTRFRYLFFMPDVEFEFPTGPIIFVFGGIVLIIVFIFSGVRRLLRPLRSIQTALVSIGEDGKGDTLPVGGSREFRAVSEAYNQMRSRITQMIASREQLLLDVSHELRSPLARIKVALAMIPENEFVGRINQDIDIMNLLIGKILDNARLRQGQYQLEWEDIHLAQLAIDVAIKVGVKVNFDASPQPSVRGDRHLIAAVFQNIMENAIKYGRLDEVNISFDHIQDRIRMSICNKGPSIPEDALPKVTEPFFRLDSARTKGGFGLGLSICQRIMQCHQGEFLVTSPKDGGVCCTLVFPPPQIKL